MAQKGFSQVILLGVITILFLAGAGGFLVLRERKMPSAGKTIQEEEIRQKMEGETQLETRAIGNTTSPVELPSPPVQSIQPSKPKTQPELKEENIYESNIYGFRFSYPADFKVRELAKEERDVAAKVAYRLEPKISTKDTSIINFAILQAPFEIKIKEVSSRYNSEARSGSTWEIVTVWNIVEAQQFTIHRYDGSGALYFLIPRRKEQETYSFELPNATEKSLEKALALIKGIAETFEFTMPSISEWPRVTARHLNQNAAFSFQYPPDWFLPTSEGVEGPVGAIHPFYSLYVPGKPDAAVNVEMYVSLEPRNIEFYSTWENQVRGITVSGYDPKSIKYETRTIAGKTTLYYTYLAHDVAPVHNALFPSPDDKFIVRASLSVGKPEEADQFWSAFEDFINSITVGS